MVMKDHHPLQQCGSLMFVYSFGSTLAVTSTKASLPGFHRRTKNTTTVKCDYVNKITIAYKYTCIYMNHVLTYKTGNKKAEIK